MVSIIFILGIVIIMTFIVGGLIWAVKEEWSDEKDKEDKEDKK